MRKFVRDIINDIKNNPDCWMEDEYTLERKTGEHWRVNLSIWISNGLFFIGVTRPVTIKFNLYEKIMMRGAINEFRKNRVLKCLEVKNEQKENS